MIQPAAADILLESFTMKLRRRRFISMAACAVAFSASEVIVAHGAHP
jgi:hypothetical protein